MRRESRPTAGALLIMFFLFGSAPLSAQVFVRGRVNADAAIDLGDPVFLLNYLFADGPAPTCLKAADANDDGELNIADPVRILGHLFGDPLVLPPPFPAPGIDPTPDNIPCVGIPIETLRVAPESISPRVGETVQLQVTGTAGGSSIDLTAAAAGTTYETDRIDRALVYRDGLVEAQATGAATITVRNGGLMATVAASVRNPAAGAHVVLATNDLGMHCIDREFSVFSILPLFNVVEAQVLRKNATGMPTLLDGDDVEVRYSPVADSKGSINTKSIGKSGFWSHIQALFGLGREAGQGILGAYMPADAPAPGPQPFAYNAAREWFEALGIPITDIDDAGATNAYPMLRVSAFDKQTGGFLGRLDAVVPVSSETDCRSCHVTGGIGAQEGGLEWSNAPDPEIQAKENILILHDFQEGTNLSSRKPVLCAGCHYSLALDLGGTGPQGRQIGKPTFSDAVHRAHGELRDGTGQPIFPPDGDAAATCYKCHPGNITRCLRGPMAGAGIQCRDCHGSMLSVAGATPLQAGGSIDGQNDGQPRRPWMDLPRCQSCHTGDAVSHLSGAGLLLAPDGIRLDRAWREGDASASPILATNKRFAENANTLYRFSTGHGGILCRGCHGSPHAEWPNPTAGANDNVAATQLQGHAGHIMECSTCHSAGTLPRDTTGGPHGMHPVNDTRWSDHAHSGAYERNRQGCRACHGTDLRGSALSKTAADRSLPGDDRTVQIPKGTPVRCNHCHGLPG